MNNPTRIDLNFDRGHKDMSGGVGDYALVQNNIVQIFDGGDSNNGPRLVQTTTLEALSAATTTASRSDAADIYSALGLNLNFPTGPQTTVPTATPYQGTGEGDNREMMNAVAPKHN